MLYSKMQAFARVVLAAPSNKFALWSHQPVEQLRVGAAHVLEGDLLQQFCHELLDGGIAMDPCDAQLRADELDMVQDVNCSLRQQATLPAWNV